MRDWDDRDLGELLSLEYGAPLPAADRSGQQIPVFGSNGEVGRHSLALVDGPGIVVGRKGSAGEVTWSGAPFWPIDTTYYALSKGPALRWLYWTLLRLPLRRMESSTGVPGLNRHDAYHLRVPTPPLPEQRQIAAILDTLDDAIRKTEQIIAKLKQVKQGLLHDLLTRGIDDNGELRDPERHPEQFKDSALGRIPRGWAVVKLGDLSDVVRGSTPRPAKDPKFFGGNYTPWITVGELGKDDWPYLDATASQLTELGARFSRTLEIGTLVLSNSGFGCGVPKLLNLAGCANDGVAAFLNLSCRVHALFLYYFLFSRIEHLRTRVARGVDQPNLNTDLLRAFEVPVPTLREQLAIADTLFSLAERVKKEETNLAKLRLLKAGLMEDLLTGRVRVTALLPREGHVP